MTSMRRLGLGLATLFGVAKLGFFIPYRYAAAVRPCSYPRAAEVLEGARGTFAEYLVAIAGFRELAGLGGDPPEPRWDQEWFPGLDGAAAYAVVRTRRPSTIVEIGSGHSTRFMARAVRDAGFACAQVCIDPAPRASLAGLPLSHQARRLEEVDPAELVGRLRDNAILFVDSSHIAMPGMDVDILMTEILPRLPTGTVVHLHDVFLPDPYPAAWAWRGYNEQTLIAALLAVGSYRPLFASHFARTRMQETIRELAVDTIVPPPAVPESSLWLERC